MWLPVLNNISYFQELSYLEPEKIMLLQTKKSGQAVFLRRQTDNDKNPTIEVAL